MSRLNQVPPMVADMITKVNSKNESVWIRENTVAVLEAIVEEANRAIREFRKERERTLKEHR